MDSRFLSTVRKTEFCCPKGGAWGHTCHGKEWDKQKGCARWCCTVRGLALGSQPHCFCFCRRNRVQGWPLGRSDTTLSREATRASPWWVYTSYHNFKQPNHSASMKYNNIIAFPFSEWEMLCWTYMRGTAWDVGWGMADVPVLLSVISLGYSCSSLQQKELI